MNVAPKPNRPPIWVFCLIGGVVLLGIISSFSSKPTAQVNQSAPASGTAYEDAGTEHVKTTDIELARAYRDNEVAAQNKYGGKTLWVKGYVTGVTLDIMSHPVIQMRGVNEFLPVQARFDDSAKDSLGAISKGDLVTMQCSDITEVISAPILSDCSLMDNSVK